MSSVKNLQRSKEVQSVVCIPIQILGRFYGFPWLVTFLPIGLRLLIALYLVAKLTVVNAVATLQRDLSSLVNPLE